MTDTYPTGWGSYLASPHGGDRVDEEAVGHVLQFLGHDD